MLTYILTPRQIFSDFNFLVCLREKLEQLPHFVKLFRMRGNRATFLFAHITLKDDESECRAEGSDTKYSAQSSTDAKTANILVVEDEGIVALHIKMTLTRMGHHVIATVDTGEEAVIVALEQRPDLILMDIRLKGQMDGIDAVHAIQEKHAVPVIYLTGQLDESTVKRAQPTNPVGYLAKPFIVSEIALLIEKVISGKHRGMF